jgi:hypothetical protein
VNRGAVDNPLIFGSRATSGEMAQNHCATFGHVARTLAIRREEGLGNKVGSSHQQEEQTTSHHKSSEEQGKGPSVETQKIVVGCYAREHVSSLFC